MTVIRTSLLVLACLFLTPAVAEEAKVDWVSSVILPEAKAIDAERLVATLRKKTTEKDQFIGFEADKGVIVLRIAGGTAMVSLMNGPVPNGELQDGCRLAWYWDKACETVKDHKAHILAVLMGTKLGKLDSAILQTKILAALLEESKAVAAYWGVNLQSREVFLAASANVSRENIPSTLWVGYRLSRENSGNFSISTRGLKEFGLMEIETRDAPLDGLKLFSLVTGIVEYLIGKGPVIKDGDMIGESQKQKIKVRHAESYWNPGDKVYRIEFGGS